MTTKAFSPCPKCKDLEMGHDTKGRVFCLACGYEAYDYGDPRTDEEKMEDGLELGWALAEIADHSEEGKHLVDKFIKRMLE